MVTISWAQHADFNHGPQNWSRLVAWLKWQHGRTEGSTPWKTYKRSWESIERPSVRNSMSLHWNGENRNRNDTVWSSYKIDLARGDAAASFLLKYLDDFWIHFSKARIQQVSWSVSVINSDLLHINPCVLRKCLNRKDAWALARWWPLICTQAMRDHFGTAVGLGKSTISGDELGELFALESRSHYCLYRLVTFLS